MFRLELKKVISFYYIYIFNLRYTWISVYVFQNIYFYDFVDAIINLFKQTVYTMSPRIDVTIIFDQNCLNFHFIFWNSFLLFLGLNYLF